MSANLIGFGCDLQQKLDAMPARLRRCRWAGDVAIDLYDIARRLHRLSLRANRSTPAIRKRNRELMNRAKTLAASLGQGVEVYRQPDPVGWPLYVLFPGDLAGHTEPQDFQAIIEQGIAVPPRP